MKVPVLPLSVAHPLCKPYRVRIQVAAAYSEDKARQGGDLGWKSRWDLQDYAAASYMRQSLVAGIYISFMSSICGMIMDDGGSCRQDVVGDFAEAAFKLNVGECRPQTRPQIPVIQCVCA